MIRRVAPAHPGRAIRPFEPVLRERVLARFDAASAYRVILVTAPAGFGKTVAIRQYLERRKISHVRCGLRREHGTLLAFLGALAAALEPVAPNMLHAYSSFYANVEQSPSIVLGIAQWIAAMLKTHRGTIVIDDLHHVREDARVGELLMELVERTGTEIRWILAARDPHVLPVATWLAYGVADVPIHEAELRLTLDEAAVAARSCDAVLTGETLGQLLALTDGWATAFTFALRVSARTGELSNLALGTREMIYGYLAEQVFRSLDELDRRFLLRTAVLPTLDVGVLRAADFDDPLGTIERLRRTTAFLTEEADGVFRYHDLFRDFLEHELRKNETHFAVAANDAATWLLRSGALPEALKLYADANNAEAIVAILEVEGAELFDRGQIQLLESMLEWLPRSCIDASPLTLALRAMITALRANYDLADQLFERALNKNYNMDSYAHIVMRYAISLIWRWRAAEAIALVGEIDASRISSAPLRARFFAFKALALSNVRDPKSSVFSALALDALIGIADVTTHVTVLQYVALVAVYEQEFDFATEHAARAYSLAENNKLFGLAGRLAMLLCSINSVKGEDEANLLNIFRMRRNAEAIGDKVAVDSTLMMAYAVYTLQGDSGKIEQIESQFDELHPWAAEVDRWPLLISTIAMQHGWCGDFIAAYKIIANSADYSGNMPDAGWRSASRWAEIAFYAAAANEVSAADAAICEAERLFASIEERAISKTHEVISGRLLVSIAAILINKMEKANKCIGQVERDVRHSASKVKAFANMARAYYISALLGSDEGELFEKLSSLAAAGMGGYAKLFSALPLKIKSDATRFASLTPTEIRVLSSIARGSSSKDVANSMGRSALTIDTHVKSIVRKLGCQGRREAVALAREQGFI